MLTDLLLKNRSYRGFDENRKITDQELTELVDGTRYCPSSINLQPFKYKIVSEKKQVEELVTLTRWARKLPNLQLPTAGKHPTAFIVICFDQSIGKNATRFAKDIGIIAQTILLLAAEKELGGCMIGNFVPKKVQEYLELAPDIEPVLVIALGKPDEEIVLTEMEEDGDTDYYRDEQNRHFVPKRKLKDILL